MTHSQAPSGSPRHPSSTVLEFGAFELKQRLKFGQIQTPETVRYTIVDVCEYWIISPILGVSECIARFAVCTMNR